MNLSRHVRIFVLLLCYSTTCLAQNGIIFQEGKKWNDVLAMAKAENKLIFVDVYTSWCGPCKLMDAEVFPQKAVGDKFNKLFVNYKLDAEKGEGPAIARKYSVQSYPNYLFINPEGVLVYRSTSSMAPWEFIEVANNAVLESKQPQTVIQLDELYPANKNDKAFMYNYLLRRTTLKLDNTNLLDDYVMLLTKEEQSDINTLQLLLDNGGMLNKSLQLGPALNVLKSNNDKFKILKNKYGETLDMISVNASRKSLSKAINNKNEVLLKEVLNTYAPASIQSFSQNRETALLEYYYGAGQFKKYLTGTKKYVDGFLLKLPIDSLAKRDAATYDYYKRVNASDLASYKHTQTIQFTNAINQYAENILSIPAVSVTDLKIVHIWTEKILAITATDTAYYKNAILHYRMNNAKFIYKLGNKKTAITKLQNAAQTAPAGYFDPLIAQMKANKKL